MDKQKEQRNMHPLSLSGRTKLSPGKAKKTSAEMGSMSLDSSESVSVANKGKIIIDKDNNSLARTQTLLTTGQKPWVFLFTHRMKVNQTDIKLRERFETFIHKSVIYLRKGKHIDHIEKPTISGLIFVQGEPIEVQDYLHENCYGHYLAKDFASGYPAVIPDAEMQRFMNLATIEDRQIRFLFHPLGYYAKGHPRIRITSGDLKGYEGYIIRFSRDRRLVTAIGNMTIAISGINKESFENAEEYVKERKKGVPARADGLGLRLTPIQQEIDDYFFDANNSIDVMAIIKAMDMWCERSNRLFQSGHYSQSAEIALCVLEELGSRIPAHFFSQDSELCDVCRTFDNQLKVICQNTQDHLNDHIQVGRESLVMRYPHLSIEV